MIRGIFRIPGTGHRMSTFKLMHF